MSECKPLTGGDAPFVLVAPRQPEEADVWCGKQATPDELRRSTGADIVYFDDEWDKALHAVDALEAGPDCLLIVYRCTRTHSPHPTSGPSTPAHHEHTVS